jgi:hypothetical protein
MGKDLVILLYYDKRQNGKMEAFIGSADAIVEKQKASMAIL